MQKWSLVSKSHLYIEIQSKKTRSAEVEPTAPDRRQKHCVCHTAAPAVEQHGSPSIRGQGTEGPWESWLLQWSSAPCLPWSFPAWPAAAALDLGLSDGTASMGLSAESPCLPCLSLPPVRSVQGRKEWPFSEPHRGVVLPA